MRYNSIFMHIRKRMLFVAYMLFSILHQSAAQNLPIAQSTVATKPFSFPLQLEMRVPFNPTAFHNGAAYHLIYELYITNYSTDTVTLRQVDLISPNIKNKQPFLIFQKAQLQSMVRYFDNHTPNNLSLAGGQAAIVFIEATTAITKPFPGQLLHRIITEKDTLDGALISTAEARLQILVPPVQGSNWTAADGPGNSEHNHHRRGTIILGSQAVNSRRYAIDWKKLRDSVSFLGNSRDAHAYFCYGEPVFAVAPGRVIAAKDGLPDNIPGHGANFHPAVPLTLDRLAGNTIVLDLGNGHYAHYMHLRPGSLRIKKGDYVHAGERLAQIGASGDAREPHLHFEVTTSPHLLAGEGVPYLINRYHLTNQNSKAKETRINQLPADGDTIDFEKKVK